MTELFVRSAETGRSVPQHWSGSRGLLARRAAWRQSSLKAYQATSSRRACGAEVGCIFVGGVLRAHDITDRNVRVS